MKLAARVSSKIEEGDDEARYDLQSAMIRWHQSMMLYDYCVTPATSAAFLQYVCSTYVHWQRSATHHDVPGYNRSDQVFPYRFSWWCGSSTPQGHDQYVHRCFRSASRWAPCRLRQSLSQQRSFGGGSSCVFRYIFVCAELEERWRPANCCRFLLCGVLWPKLHACGAEGSGNDVTDSTRFWSKTRSWSSCSCNNTMLWRTWLCARTLKAGLLRCN